ncbi:MAG: hypothetical protein OEY49_06610 [Candidatus Heimdallarchaeota archaeon]|nr:hypothetical protein [Candidatus Heimdallarchaeota archaeon]
MGKNFYVVILLLFLIQQYPTVNGAVIPTREFDFNSMHWKKTIVDSNTYEDIFSTHSGKTNWEIIGAELIITEQYGSSYLYSSGVSTNYTATDSYLNISAIASYTAGHASPQASGARVILYRFHTNGSWYSPVNKLLTNNETMTEASVSFDGLTVGVTYGIFIGYDDAWLYNWVQKVTIKNIRMYVDFSNRISQPTPLWSLQQYTDPTSIARSVSLSPDGTKFVVGYDSSVGVIYNSSDGSVINNLIGHTDRIQSVSWSPDGSKIATGSFDNSSKIWNPDTGALIISLLNHSAEVMSVSWNADGTKLASGAYDNSTKIWNIITGEVISTFINDAPVDAVSWSPDESIIISGNLMTITMLNSSNGERINSFTAHSNNVTSLAWNSDSTAFVSGSLDNTVKIWNASTGDLIISLQEHTNDITSVTWSSDGKYIASSSLDNIVKLYNSTTGELLTNFVQTGNPYSVSFNSDSDKLLVSVPSIGKFNIYENVLTFNTDFFKSVDDNISISFNDTKLDVYYYWNSGPLIPVDTSKNITAINNPGLNNLNISIFESSILVVSDILRVLLYNSSTDYDGDGLPDFWEDQYGTNLAVFDQSEDIDDDGLTNIEEYQIGTDPLDIDTDNDLMDDGWEVTYGLDPTQSSDADSDLDNDNLTNLEEYNLGTIPDNTDSDDDLMEDGWEVDNGFNPTNPNDGFEDADQDGLTNSQEVILGTDPFDEDSDNDQLPDGWEFEYGYDPLNAADANDDLDEDGLTNIEEYNFGTSPNNSDTDDDGMSDSWEIEYELNPLTNTDSILDPDRDGLINVEEFNFNTSPINPDTDGDSMPDGWEVDNDLNPTNAVDRNQDADNDGLSNAEEFIHHTSPINSDTDGDSMPDGWEVANSLDPLNSADASLDTDGDGLSNKDEYMFGMNPNDNDSNGDGIIDSLSTGEIKTLLTLPNLYLILLLIINIICSTILFYIIRLRANSFKSINNWFLDNEQMQFEIISSMNSITQLNEDTFRNISYLELSNIASGNLQSFQHHIGETVKYKPPPQINHLYTAKSNEYYVLSGVKIIFILSIGIIISNLIGRILQLPLVTYEGWSLFHVSVDLSILLVSYITIHILLSMKKLPLINHELIDPASYDSDESHLKKTISITGGYPAALALKLLQFEKRHQEYSSQFNKIFNSIISEYTQILDEFTSVYDKTENQELVKISKLRFIQEMITNLQAKRYSDSIPYIQSTVELLDKNILHHLNHILKENITSIIHTHEQIEFSEILVPDSIIDQQSTNVKWEISFTNNDDLPRQVYGVRLSLLDERYKVTEDIISNLDTINILSNTDSVLMPGQIGKIDIAGDITVNKIQTIYPVYDLIIKLDDILYLLDGEFTYHGKEIKIQYNT